MKTPEERLANGEIPEEILGCRICTKKSIVCNPYDGENFCNEFTTESYKKSDMEERLELDMSKLQGVARKGVWKMLKLPIVLIALIVGIIISAIFQQWYLVGLGCLALILVGFEYGYEIKNFKTIHKDALTLALSPLVWQKQKERKPISPLSWKFSQSRNLLMGKLKFEKLLEKHPRITGNDLYDYFKDKAVVWALRRSPEKTYEADILAQAIIEYSEKDFDSLELSDKNIEAVVNKYKELKNSPSEKHKHPAPTQKEIATIRINEEFDDKVSIIYKFYYDDYKDDNEIDDFLVNNNLEFFREKLSDKEDKIELERKKRLGELENLEEKDFPAAIIASVERKAQFAKDYIYGRFVL